MMCRWKLDEYEILLMWEIKERALTKVTPQHPVFISQMLFLKNAHCEQ